MVDVKQAVQKATSFVVDLFPDARDIRLEEVEPTSSEWSVVISFKNPEPTGLGYVIGTDNRVFKRIAIDSLDGSPISLKVWKL